MKNVIILTRKSRCDSLIKNSEVKSALIKSMDNTCYGFSLGIDNGCLSFSSLDKSENIHFLWDGNNDYCYTSQNVISILNFIEQVHEKQKHADGVIILIHPNGPMKGSLLRNNLIDLVKWNSSLKIFNKSHMHSYYCDIMKTLEDNYYSDADGLVVVENKIVSAFNSKL